MAPRRFVDFARIPHGDRTPDPLLVPGALRRLGTPNIQSTGSAMEFLPDGRLVTAGRGGLALWDSETAACRRIPLPGVALMSLALHPGSGTALAGDFDGQVWRFDLEAGRVEGAWRVHPTAIVRGVWISEDARRAWWMLGRGEVGRLDLETGACDGGELEGGKTADRPARSPDGRLVAIPGERILLVLDGTLETVLWRDTSEVRRPRSAAFHPDGAVLAFSTQYPPTLRVVSTRDFSSRAPDGYAVGQAGGYEMAFTPDGRHLALGRIEDTVILRFPEAEVVQTLPQEKGYVAGLAFSPDGELLAVAGAERRLRFWEWRQGRHRFRRSGHREQVQSMTQSFDGTRVITVDRLGSRRAWDLETGSEAREAPLDLGPRALPEATWRTPDGSLVARHARSRDALEVLEISEDEPARVLHRLHPHEKKTREVAFHPQGRFLATIGEDAHLKLFRLLDGDEVLDLHEPAALRGFMPPGSGFVGPRLCFSPDGLTLALGGCEGVLVLYDLQHLDRGGLQERLHLARRVEAWGHAATIEVVDFARGSEWVLTASLDGTALVWSRDALLRGDAGAAGPQA